MKVINDYVKENNIIPEKNLEKTTRKRTRSLSGNYQSTKEMILKKSSIEEMAKVQELKERTIIDHIEKIIDSGKKININYLIASRKNFEIIKSAFKKIGIERLAPIYNYFNEEYSYEEIRLVRMILKSEKNIIYNIKTNYHERLGQIKEKFPNAYEPWKEEKDNKLKKLYLENILIDEISQILKRQPNAIRSRLRKKELL